MIIARGFAATPTNIISLGTKTALGSTTVIYMPGCYDTTVQYTVAGIGTNVVVRLEGSNNNDAWFNLDTGDTTHTANGTYALHYTHRINYIRFQFVSYIGGSPTIENINAALGVIS
jgi:hypothetical protein